MRLEIKKNLFEAGKHIVEKNVSKMPLPKNGTRMLMILKRNGRKWMQKRENG